MTGVVLLAAGPVTHAAQGAAAEPEPSLEPEFRQLRERLEGAPEFQGSDAAEQSGRHGALLRRSRSLSE